MASLQQRKTSAEALLNLLSNGQVRMLCVYTSGGCDSEGDVRWGCVRVRSEL